MPPRVLAKINADVLKWARETRRIPIEVAASAIGVAPEELGECEGGRSQLTMAQLRLAANKYRRPLAVFYSPDVPKEPSGLPDFRRLHGTEAEPMSAQLLYEIRCARHRRDTAIRLARDSTSYSWNFVGSVRQITDAEGMARELRSIIGLREMPTRRPATKYEAFNRWRAAVESTGVLVFLATRIEVSEMRGFAIAETPFPVIGLNRKDDPKPRSFSLLHEFCHILMGRSGISDMEDRATTDEVAAQEVFCNAVAASALVPADDLLRLTTVAGHRGDEWAEDDLRDIANHFMVSKEVVLRRFLTLGLTTQRFYQHMRDDWRRRPPPPPPASAPRESIPDKVMRTQGAPYVRLILDALHGDRITAADVSDLLDMQLKHLRPLEQAISG